MHLSTDADLAEGRNSRFPLLRAYFVLLRPQQWTKNLLVLAALLFASQMGVDYQVVRAGLAFVAFCLVSSAVYVLNDILDCESDRAHPRNRRRPIAAGLVSPAAGYLIAGLLLTGGLLLIRATTLPALLCLSSYVLLQAFYITILRHHVILDVMSIASGFILRAVVGAYAIEVIISPWLLICTLHLALFLALSKRRSEILSTHDPLVHRRVLGAYSIPLLDQFISIVTSCTVLAYILYTFAEQTTKKFHTQWMPLTIPFVLYGIFRYLYLIHKTSAGGEPEILLIKDIPLLADILLWSATVAWITSLG
jgi:4-hydroxybenzoate polyprenyltransferase